MTFDTKRIYELLPSIYRVRDEEQGKILEAIVGIIAEQAIVVQDNIDELYDNWFIETCREWVVPYIGDLLGVRALNEIDDVAGVSQRAYVANTLGYRRRKGIAPVLEQLTLDVTGWRAHVVEFFEMLQTSQHMNHVRLHRPLTPDLRRMDELDRIKTAFDTVAHSADVRHITSRRGLHNIPNLGIFAWRLQSYPLWRVDARRSECMEGSASSPPVSPPNSPPISPPLSPPTSPPTPLYVFTFNPTGKRTQLFNSPRTEDSITHISSEINVPGLLRRRRLFDELDALRDAFATGSSREYEFFAKELQDEGVFEIIHLDKNDHEERIHPEEIQICNLESCCTIPPSTNFKQLIEDGSMVSRKIKVLADPVTGRFMFTNQDPDSRAIVEYSYGFSGDLGGGSYNRQNSIAKSFLDRGEGKVWQAGVSKTLKSVHGELMCTTINEALVKWHAQSPGTLGVITILDSRTYEEDLIIEIKQKSRLLIISADWPKRKDSIDGSDIRNTGDLLAEDIRPLVLGNISIRGQGDFEKQDTCGETTFNGLLVSGQVSVLEGQLGAFNMRHCTIVPENGGFGMDSGSNKQSNRWLRIDIQRSICGSIQLVKTAAVQLNLQDSIIQHSSTQDDRAISAPDTALKLNGVTVFGSLEANVLEASNCIFDGIVEVKRRQQGCIRFSYVTVDSKAPRLYRCQPAMEIDDNLAAATEKKGSAISSVAKKKIKDEVNAWLVPSFTSTSYDHYGYAQISTRCPTQITTGADDGSEMGSFSFLKQPQRNANLHIALNEYSPLGLEAGVIFVT